MNRTPRAAGGTGVPGVSRCLRAATVWPSAYLASAIATTSATIRTANVSGQRTLCRR